MIPISEDNVVLFGTPPQELKQKFTTLKYCVLMLFFAVLAQIVAGGVLGGLAIAITVVSDLAIEIVMLFVGVWLVKDDPLFEKIFAFLQNTCCFSCAETCPTGLGCLRIYCLMNMLIFTVHTLFMLLTPADADSLRRQLKENYDALAFTDPVPANIAWYIYSGSWYFIIFGELVGSCVARSGYNQAMSMGLGIDPDQLGAIVAGREGRGDVGGILQNLEMGRNVPRAGANSDRPDRQGGSPGATPASPTRGRPGSPQAVASGAGDFSPFSGSPQRLD